MEIMKDAVLIKEVDGGRNGDRVIYIDNLPKSLLYRRAKKLVIDRTNPQQNLVPAYKMIEGNRVETGEMEDELLPGIEMSQTGDGAYCFFTYYNEAKAALAAIDRFIQANLPVAERIQERIFYALQPGVLSSGAIPLHNIPHIVLPAPVSPPSKDVQEGTHVAALEKPARKGWSEEQKEAARKRMARAREVRRSQQVGDLPK